MWKWSRRRKLLAGLVLLVVVAAFCVLVSFTGPHWCANGCGVMGR